MRKARAEMLVPGDIVAIYAGNSEPSSSATIEELPVMHRAHVTIQTTAGRFELPNGSQVDVLAWAPLPPIPERLL